MPVEDISDAVLTSCCGMLHATLAELSVGRVGSSFVHAAMWNWKVLCVPNTLECRNLGCQKIGSESLSE